MPPVRIRSMRSSRTSRRSLASWPAHIVELHPEDVDIKRGYYVEYPPTP